jgi:hypothetical protein
VGPIFTILPCKECKVATTLPLFSLEEIKQYRTQSATEFVNFVCPNCGLGSAHSVASLEKRESISFPTLVRPTLYCASLRCSEAHCKLHVLIHTLAESNASGPKIGLHRWKVDTLVCVDGHYAQSPAGLLTHHIFS